MRLVLPLVLLGCSPTVTVPIEGGAQKGPMVIGSSIEVVVLDARGQPTGQVFPTTTRDDLGTFQVEVEARLPAVVEVVAEGYFFDEVAGGLADAPLTLRSFVELTSEGAHTTVVNPITHLAALRARHLFVEGLEPAEAIAQAEAEVVAPLGFVVPEDLPNAEDLDLLGGDTAENGLLLATSCLLASAAHQSVLGTDSSPTAKLQEILNTTALDLEVDGTLDAPRLAWLDLGRTTMDGPRCMAHLAARFAELGHEDLEIPNVAMVTDLDGDGIPDALDPDADGDGILAEDERLVDGAALSEAGFGPDGHFDSDTAVVIDNREGDRGGHAWVLFVNHGPVQRTAPFRAEREPGVPLTGLEQVAVSEYALPYFLRHHDGTLWTWSPGRLAQVDDDAPDDVEELRTFDQIGVMARTTAGDWHLVVSQMDDDWSWQPMPEHQGRRGLGAGEYEFFTWHDDEGAPWFQANQEATPQAVAGIEEAVVDTLGSYQAAYFLGEGGAVYRAQVTNDVLQAATEVPDLEGVLHLTRRPSNSYAGTADQLWNVYPGILEEVEAPVPVFDAAGATLLHGPDHVTLGTDANVHLVPRVSGTPRTIEIPK